MPRATQDSIAEHLELAWIRIPAHGSDFDLPDIMRLADIKASWPSYKAALVDSIANETYHPQHVDIVDLPKDRLTVRPLARLSVSDRLVYEACVFAMASEIDRSIPHHVVYSHRWWQAQGILLPGVKQWLKMMRHGRYLHKKYPSFLVAKTDVTSFYEYVDIDILMEDLATLAVPSWATKNLDRFLRNFNELNHAWGLPQGSDASGILANLYLLPVDRVIEQAGVDHVRYSDDMYLFGNDWLELRKVLLHVTQTLRSRHLSLSHGKTRIIPSHSVLAEFKDAEKDAIKYGVSNFPEEAPATLHDYFDRITAKDPVNNRNLRFILSKLRQIDDDYAVTWLLTNVGEIPHLARESLAYLDHFCKSNPEVGRNLVELLVNDKIAIYPYAEQHLLACMIRNGVEDPRASQEAWHILLDKNKESFVRELAARYIGRYPRSGDGGRLRQQFQREFDNRVQRALLVACYETGHCSERWLQAVAVRPALEVTAKYLLAGPAVPVPWVEGTRAKPTRRRPIISTSSRPPLRRLPTKEVEWPESRRT